MGVQAIFSLTAVLLTLDASAALQCRSCDHVTDPTHCEVWTTCGTDEICFTREFEELDQSQGYKLGCEATQMCSLYLSAQNSSSDDDKCFNCCEQDECNKDLCSDSVIQPTVTPAPQVCPEFYLQMIGKCYFFGLWNSSWLGARNYCRKVTGSNLVSINDRRENDYINSVLVKLAAPVSGFWLGGFYSSASAEWEWSDRTLLKSYLNWEKNYPPKMNNTLDYYVMLPNPVSGRAQRWKTDIRGHQHPFICEVARLT